MAEQTEKAFLKQPKIVDGEAFTGTCHGTKMMRSIIVRHNYLHCIKKYQRPLSKIVRFNVLEVIPAGSSGGGKKAFIGM